jgi:hypothetical protein
VDSFVLLGLTITLPAVLIVLLRSDAAVILLSLCAGSVLVDFIGSDAADFVSQNAQTLNGWAYVGLLLLPAVLSLIALRKSVSSVKLPVNMLTAVCVGIMTALLAIPLLPYDIQSNLTDNFLWDKMNQYQAAVISASIAIALVSLWMSAHGGLKLRKKHH